MVLSSYTITLHFFTIKQIEGGLFMPIHNSMKCTKESFEQMFQEKTYYEKQTRDDAHLQRILDRLPIHEGDHILDLGTGTGYLAVPLAWNHPDCQVIGLDIIEDTLKENQNKASTLHLTNLSYQSYNGITMPFEDHTFDIIVTRFALHHFSDITKTFQEIKRILKPGGIFFLSDPTTNEVDTTGFIDTFMQLKQDGHIHFYRKNEYEQLAKKAGFHLKDSFLTTLRFPSISRTPGYLAMEGSVDTSLKDSYHITVEGNEVYVTVQVLNLMLVHL